MAHCIVHLLKDLLNLDQYDYLANDLLNALNNSHLILNDDIEVRIFEFDYSFLEIHKQEFSYINAELIFSNTTTSGPYSVIQNIVHNTLVNYFKNMIHKYNITTRITFLEPEVLN